MSRLLGLRHMLRSFFGRRRADEETREELAFHLERQTRKHIDEGLSREAAARQAAHELGGVERWREETSDARRGIAILDFVTDLRYAVRALVARPAFALSAIATVAIGVGASVAIFAVADGTLLRPLPFRNPSQLVAISMRMPLGPASMVDMTWSYPKFVMLRRDQRVLSALALHSPEQIVVSGDAGAERIAAESATSDFFQLLGASPIIGRTFGEDQDRPGAATPEVVLSEGLWRTRYGARATAIGEWMTIGGVRHRIVGVMPRTFRGLAGDAQAWIPLTTARSAAVLAMAGAHNLEIVARLRDGVSIDAARAGVAAIGRRINEAFPDEAGHWGAAAYSLDERRVNPAIRRSLQLLGIAVGLLLGIVCANLGTLLLTRGAARRRELAVRAALGADRWRIVRQLLTESVVLAGAGALVGLVLAWSGMHMLATTLPLSAPTTSAGTDLTRLAFSDVSLDIRALTFALVVWALIALGVGSIAAVRANAERLSVDLRHGAGASGATARGFLAANGLVIAQTALAFVFLAASALTIQSLRRALEIPLGYVPSHLATIQLTLDPLRAASDSNAQLWNAILSEVTALPGVTTAAVGSCSPLGMRCDGTGVTATGHSNSVHVAYVTVSADYFAALRTPIVAGRAFAPAEMDGMRHVAIVNRAAARAVWGTDDPLTTPILGDDGKPIDVVGIVEDARYGDIERPAAPAVFFPHRNARGVLFVRTKEDPSAITPSLRAAIRRAGAGNGIGAVRTMDSRLADAMARNRLSLQVFTAFALSALLLAAVGVYGSLALRVAMRTREFAIRRALGASTRSLGGSVAKQAAGIAIAGGAVGIVGAVAISRLLVGLLYDVTAVDPVAFVMATGLVIVATAAAAAMPTARALRADPREAMRAE